MEPRFTSGDVLGQTFSVYFANFVPFSLICLIVLVPNFVFQTWVTLQQQADPMTLPWVPLIAAMLSGLLIPIATGALTYGVFQHVRNKQTSLADCLGIGFKRLLPVLGVGILAGIIQGIGTILCLIPGFIAATILAAAVPTAVIERPGVINSLERSAQLTKGFRWSVFGVIFGIGVLQIATSFLVQLPLRAASINAYLGAFYVHSLIFTGLSATAPALIYYHLRRVKESIDVEDIAAVFD